MTGITAHQRDGITGVIDKIDSEVICVVTIPAINAAGSCICVNNRIRHASGARGNMIAIMAGHALNSFIVNHVVIEVTV